MIGGYVIHVYNKDSLKIFDLMKYLGINLNNITFLYILLALIYAFLVDEGYKML